MAGNVGTTDNVGERGQRDAEGGGGDQKTSATNVSSPNAIAAGAEGFDFIAQIASAQRQNEQFLAAVQRKSWTQTLRAFRNEHLVGSKYTSAPYRNRSKIFRPKVRTAIRKNMAAAAAALFSTSDVVQIKAEQDSDPVKQASAEVLAQIVNYRLDRTATKSGVPWFLVAIAANLDSQLTGICVSKQFWERTVSRETHMVTIEEEIEEVATNEDGYPIFDEMGAPVMGSRKETRDEEETTEHITADRPMVINIPPENCMVDPAAPWYAPAQLSSYFVAKFPMSVDDAETMLATEDRSGTEWIKLTRAELEQCAEDLTAKNVRVERSGGVDRFDAGSNRDNGKIVWLYECFVRVDGTDYTFWTVGDRYYASKIRTTRDAYPEQMGERPYVYGYGQIESHNIAPMSAADSIMPLQIEANDVANLALDAMKQSLSPIAVVRQGTVFDWKALQHRGAADTTISVKNVDDIRFEQMPPPNATAQQTMNNLNVDMDELTGSFAGSSVQANRQLNETVGGMRMLSGSANAVTEFDLRVWVETWTEPALRQIVRCIQYYEDDERIFAIAGARAKMFERYGVNEITDADLESEVSVRIDVGIGTSDPMQKLQKFGMAMQGVATAAPFFDKKFKLNGEEVIKEIMGSAGYNDGMRFFVPEENPEGAMSPEQMEAQIKAMIEKEKIASAERIAAGNNSALLEKTDRAGKWAVIEAIIGSIAEEERQAVQIQAEKQANAVGGLADLFKARMSSEDKNRATNLAHEAAREKNAAAGRKAA